MEFSTWISQAVCLEETTIKVKANFTPLEISRGTGYLRKSSTVGPSWFGSNHGKSFLFTTYIAPFLDEEMSDDGRWYQTPLSLVSLSFDLDVEFGFRKHWTKTPPDYAATRLKRHVDTVVGCIWDFANDVRVYLTSLPSGTLANYHLFLHIVSHLPLGISMVFK